MRLLMLSGNSRRNRDWIITAQQHFEDLFDETYIQQYAHWSSGASWIDLGSELDTLRKTLSLHFSEDAVFAKSIGSVLTVQAIEQRIVRPKWLLFCGLPYGYIIKNYSQFGRILAASAVPVTVVHNLHDPVGTSKDVKSYLDESFGTSKNFTFIETEGETHDYTDIDLLRTQLIRLRDTHD